MDLAAVGFISKHLSIGRLPEALLTINSYLDTTTTLTIQQASVAGFPRLIVRLIQLREAAVDASYLAYVCNLGIDRAASDGNLPVIGEFLLLFPGIIVTNATTVAAEHEQLDVLHWLQRRGNQVLWPQSVFRAAVNSLDTLRCLAQYFDMTGDPWILYDAIAYSTDDVVQYLWQLFNTRGLLSRVGGFAVSRATRELAMWMVNNTTAPLIISIEFAAAAGDLEYINWALNEAPPRVTVLATSRAIDMAAAEGRDDVVRCLHRHGYTCTSTGFDEASAHGHLTTVQFLHSAQQVAATPRALYGAATNGHKQLFQWLLSAFPNLECPQDMFDDVCGAGHIHIASLLHATRMGGGTVNAMDLAAENGHLDMLAWLHQARREGCTTRAFDAASSAGHQPIVEWLHKNRLEGATTNAMDGAASNGHLDTAKWLHEHRGEGCTDAAMLGAARSGDTATVAWLQEHYHSICTQPAIDQAVVSGSLELVTWFVDVRQEVPSAQAIENAATNEDFPMCELLRKHSAPPPPSTYAFVANISTGNLYLAAWIANNYPACADIEYLASRRAYTCWNSDVLQQVFHIHSS